MCCGRVGAPLALAVALSFGAGCSKQNTPTAPTAVTTNGTTQSTPPNNPGNVSITGTVSSAAGAPIAGAHVDVASGTQATTSSTQSATTDASGQYALRNLAPGAITLRFSAFAYVTQSKDL